VQIQEAKEGTRQKQGNSMVSLSEIMFLQRIMKSESDEFCIEKIKLTFATSPRIKYLETENKYIEDPHVNPSQFLTPEAYNEFMEKTCRNPINFPGRCGWTLLGAACMYGKIKLAKWLIIVGANVNIGNDNMSCLSCMFYPETTTTARQMEIYRLLIANGASLNNPDKTGFYPLEYALKNHEHANESVLFEMKRNSNHSKEVEKM